MSPSEGLVRGSNCGQSPDIPPSPCWGANDGHHGQTSVGDLSVPGRCGNTRQPGVGGIALQLCTPKEWRFQWENHLINGEHVHCHVWVPKGTQNHRPSFEFSQTWVAQSIKHPQLAGYFNIRSDLLLGVPPHNKLRSWKPIVSPGQTRIEWDIRQGWSLKISDPVPGTCETEMDTLGTV